VQRHAMKTWEDGRDFLTELKSDPEVTSEVPAKKLEEMFDLAYHLKHVDTIFKRVFG
jgi:adenylosuccinate lyase